ncbi:MAG: hypothetical protein ACRCTE_08430 [Cellulosilyticaceae bacterium]
MITVAVTNVREKSRPILEFIQEIADQNNIHVRKISPTHKLTYKNHQKMVFKEYMRWMEVEENVDLLLVELSKEALEKSLHEQVQFHICVLGQSSARNREHMIRRIASDYYVIPDRCNIDRKECITYGWGNSADISASSAQTNIEGQLEIQCCIQSTICSLQGEVYGPKEFGVKCKQQRVENTLAGIATLLLYGIQIGQ